MNKILLILLINTQIQAQIFLSNSGNISFFSETPLENITAINDNVSAVFDASNNDLVFKLSISDFIFPNALMQEHFNENYMDSSVYPKANFVGNIQKFSLGELTEYEKNHKIIGVLTIRGIEKNVTINCQLNKANDRLYLKADFSVLTSDFDIQVPKVVRNKISKEIKIKVDYELIEKL